MKLSQKQIEAINSANIANIAKKLKSGKTLSSSELKILEEGNSQSAEVANNKEEAASALGVSRKTFDRWGKIPGAPGPRSNGKIDLGQWREYIKSKGLKGGESSDIEQEKLLRMRAQRVAQELRNDITRGKYLEREPHRAELIKVMAQMRGIIDQKIINELPPLAIGMDVAAIREKCIAACDAAWRGAYEYLEGLKSK